MKLIGKYRHFQNGDIKIKKYLIRKTIPSYKRRVFVFGPSGYGKSSVLIANAIMKAENVLLISSLPEAELNYMPAVSDKISACNHLCEINANFTGKMAYCLDTVPTARIEELFINEVIPYLESSGFLMRTDVTIILDNLVFLTRLAGYLDQVTKEWRCKVIINLTCGIGACDVNFLSRKWWRLPVFTPLLQLKN